MTTPTATGDRLLLLQACLHEPSDDVVRGVYADHLREYGDAFDQAHASLIDASLTLSRYRGHEPATDGEFFTAIAHQAEHAPAVLAVQLGALLGWKWEEVAWDNDATAPDRLTAVRLPASRPGSRRGPKRGRWRHAAKHAAVIYERGMVHTVRLPLSVWRERAAAILANCPLERVEVLDVPGLTLRIVGPTDGWGIAGRLELPARRTTFAGRVPSRFGSAIREQSATAFTVTWAASAIGGAGWSRDTVAAEANYGTFAIAQNLRAAAGDRWPGPREEDVEAFLETDNESLRKRIAELEANAPRA